MLLLVVVARVVVFLLLVVVMVTSGGLVFGLLLLLVVVVLVLVLVLVLVASVFRGYFFLMPKGTAACCMLNALNALTITKPGRHPARMTFLAGASLSDDIYPGGGICLYLCSRGPISITSYYDTEFEVIWVRGWALIARTSRSMTIRA